MRSIVIRQRLMRLPPLSRLLLLGTIDVLLIPLSIWMSFWLRTAEPLGAHLLASLWLFPGIWAIALSIYALSGQYRGLTRYVSSAAIYAVAVRNALSVLLVYLAGLLLPVTMPPHSIWLLLTVLTGGVRFALRDARNPDGDIAIACTGLRPGEKLYEELLIDADSRPTAHPLIYRARERAIPPDALWPQLYALEAAIARQDEPAALALLAQLVPEWRRGYLY